MNLRILLAGSLLALLAACSVPINLDFDVLGETDFQRTGSFVVGEGGLTDTERAGPVLVEVEVDDRASVNSATLEYEICFTPVLEEGEDVFSGSLTYQLYAAPASVVDEAVFAEANAVGSAGSVNLDGFTTQRCLSGTETVSGAQLEALRAGQIKLAAEVSGDAAASADTTVDWELRRLILHIAASAGL